MCSNKFALKQDLLFDVFKKTYPDLGTKQIHNVFFAQNKLIGGYV